MPYGNKVEARSGFVILTTAKGSGQQRTEIVAGLAGSQARDLNLLRDLVTSGVYTAAIDGRFALELIVDAHRYVDTGRKK